jgi:hypothetical protein
VTARRLLLLPALATLACGGCSGLTTQTDDAGLALGDPCTDSARCTGGFCIDQSLDPSFVGGYCSAVACDPFGADECGDHGVCFDTEIYPPVCARRCVIDSDCRVPDYACIGVCVPDDFTAKLDSTGLLTGQENEIRGVVAAVNDVGMMARARVLAGEAPCAGLGLTIRSRAVGHPDHAVALDCLEGELRAIGLATTRQELTAGGRALTNLIGDLAGTDAALPPVLVTAHYDSTASGTDRWDLAVDPAPGAGDDASGVVIALEIAQIVALSGLPPVAPLRVVFFDGEEIGLVGSDHYAQDLVTTGSAVGCALNVDMVHATVAATAGRVWFLFDDTSRDYAALGAEAAGLYARDLPLITSSYATGNADQASFWDRGQCAVGMSSWPRVQTNHTVDDTTATFDQDYFGRVARAAAAVVAAWAYYPPGT